jgi:hypothetical protein
MTPVPTEHSNNVYQTRDGKQHLISEMDAVQLMTALYDMLMRKAKHNHKLNKMLEVGEVLSNVTKALHVELGKREASMADLNEMQISADLGKLKLHTDDSSIKITSNS